MSTHEEQADPILRLCEILAKLPAEERALVWESIALKLALRLRAYKEKAS